MIDHDKMLERMGSRETMLRILRSFTERSEKTLANLRDSRQAEDWTRLRRDAHSLKGASGYIACDRMHATAFALQVAAEAMSADKVPETPIDTMMERVEADISSVLQAIRHILAAETASVAEGGELRPQPTAATAAGVRRDENPIPPTVT